MVCWLWSGWLWLACCMELKDFHTDGLGEAMPVLVWCLRVNGKEHCFAS